MHACIHTYIHHTYIHTYIHTHTYIHYITLHYITLHYITLHYITLHYITLHSYIRTCTHTHTQTYIYIYIYMVTRAPCGVVLSVYLGFVCIVGVREKTFTSRGISFSTIGHHSPQSFTHTAGSRLPSTRKEALPPHRAPHCGRPSASRKADAGWSAPQSRVGAEWSGIARRPCNETTPRVVALTFCSRPKPHSALTF